MRGRKRFRKRSRWQRLLSKADRHAAGGHSMGQTCAYWCGSRYNFKERMWGRQHRPWMHFGPEPGMWGTCSADDPRARRQMRRGERARTE